LINSRLKTKSNDLKEVNMAKKADPSGVPAKEVRQAIAGSSFLVILKVKYEDWQKGQANRRRQAKAAKARTAKLLGIPPKLIVPADSKKSRLADLLGAAFIVLAVLGLILTAVWYFTRPPVVVVPRSAEVPLQPTVMVTPVPSIGDSSSTQVTVADFYQLRVETQQLVNARRGMWAPIANIGIYLSPFTNGDRVPDFSRNGTRLLETALKTTTDDVLVAQATFDAPEGLYWVAVDETTLPPGCAVWVPEFEEDEGIAVSRWKIVDLTAQGDFNTMVVKFQIVCGVVVSVSPTPVSPRATPTPNPTEPTQPPGPTPTTPVPSPTTPVPTTPPPPTPTDSCGPDCVEPSTPVPTPTEYPPDVPTPTPVR
jgi:hypothetical protein